MGELKISEGTSNNAAITNQSQPSISRQDYFRQEFRHHKPIKTINGQDYCRQEDVLWDLHPYPVGTKSGANLVVGADSLRSAEDGAGPETGAKNQQV